MDPGKGLFLDCRIPLRLKEMESRCNRQVKAGNSQ